MSTLNEHFANRPRTRQPYPDPVVATRAKERQLPSPPIDFHIKGEGMAAISARNALDTLLGSWTAIKELAANPETDLRTLSAKGFDAMQRGLRAVDQASNTVRANIAATEKTIADKTMPPISDALAGEIRAMVRQDPAKAFDMVRKDARVSSAVLRGPAMLSGLKSDQYDMVRQMAELTFAPDEAKLRDESVAALGVLESAGGRALSVLGGKLGEWKDKAPNMGALDG